MKILKHLYSMAFTIFLFSVSVYSRSVPTFVSIDWLEQNLNNPKLVVVDIRGGEQYKKGHIPHAASAPFAAWAVENNGLSVELPSDNALLDLLGKVGISSNSVVVIVNRTDTDFSRADATRVAWTCIIAGVKDVGVLDGGFSRWMKANKPISTDTEVPKSSGYAEKPDRSKVASKNYVLGKIGKSVIVDNRTPEDYFGITSKQGHIKSAVNLPAPWAYDADGSLKKEEDLQAMAAGVIGRNKSQEVILYCGVGGFASTWWFLLTQMLGYQNVKLYDGSMQEWIQDSNAPVTSFSWR